MATVIDRELSIASEGGDGDIEEEEFQGAGNGGRQPVERLWDDDSFRKRIVETCQERGIKVRTAMIRAGTSPKFMEPAPNGRNTNIIMRIAKALEAHPAYLMFGPTVATGPNEETEPQTQEPMHLGATVQSNPATADQRLAVIAQICAAHWLHFALDPTGARGAADLSLRQIAVLTQAVED